MRYLFLIAIFSCFPICTASAADDEKWGDLSATFLYDGDPPEPRELKIDKDTGLYKHPIYDPALIVDRESKGIANVVVWLYLARDAKTPAIHTSYEKLAKQDVTIDTVKGLIAPHVALVWLPQTLLIKNSEPVGHTRKVDAFNNPAISELFSGGGSSKRQFTKSEPLPVPVNCTIHPWESGFILIRDNPYMAVSDRLGKLQIKNLPVGEHTLILWHERCHLVKDLKRNGRAEMLQRGKLLVTIKPGGNDLGEIRILPVKAERLEESKP